MKRFRVVFLRRIEFEEFVFAETEEQAEELGWQQLGDRDDPEPYDTETKLVGVEDCDA